MRKTARSGYVHPQRGLPCSKLRPRNWPPRNDHSLFAEIMAAIEIRVRVSSERVHAAIAAITAAEAACGNRPRRTGCQSCGERKLPPCIMTLHDVILWDSTRYVRERRWHRVRNAPGGPSGGREHQRAAGTNRDRARPSASTVVRAERQIN